ncbi:uncharacterized protein LOC105629548 [Jatropha curcas]|uniref:uncharacterized protein LOC105629548 n=1 Tax=Jatropha curcas TaxID=180498 RepID=UPI001893AD5C|nr:uncharacterized protein LOC105629548 [Jatropha curcas]
MRLTIHVDCLRFLLRQGLTFRGHDESECSSNKDNFLELLQFLTDHNEAIVYLLIKLVLTLLIAIASVERAFSSIKIVKN